MSDGFDSDPTATTNATSQEINWDSREENLKNETVVRERRIATAFKLLWQNVDSLMSSLRVIQQPPCQLDIQLIQKHLTRSQQHLDIIKQQNNQLLKIRGAGTQIEAIKKQLDSNNSLSHLFPNIRCGVFGWGWSRRRSFWAC